MADQQDVIIMDGDTEHHFPAGFDPVKAAAIVKGTAAPQANTQISQAEWDALPAKDKLQRLAKWGGYAISGAMGWGDAGRQAVDNPTTTLATAALPTVASAAGKGITELATNPNVPKVAASAGRGIGAAAPLAAAVAKAVAGDPVGAAYSAAATAPSSWAGGKVGWFSGKLAQGAALSIVNAVDKAKSAIEAGIAPSKAAMDASEGNPSLFAAVMSHFMKSGGIK